MRNLGFSILECIFVIAIMATSILLAIPNLQRTAYMYLGRASMHELQLALQYARSAAIAQQEIILICPSSNGLGCGNNWQSGILVTSTQIKKFFKLYIRHGKLTLQQSGNSNIRLQILPNGMLHTNGHFNLHSKDNWPEFNLYFNKALRTYLKTSS